MTNLKFQREREQKGITLIALVVTIIVLIILAGVSINMLVGENGIINMAQRAKEDTQQAAKDEQQALASAFERDYVTYNGQLHVEGAKLMNEHNEEVRLKGTVLNNGKDGKFNKNLLSNLKNNWNNNVIKVGCWSTEAGQAGIYTDEARMQEMYQIIDDAIDLDMYVIVIFWSGNNLTENVYNEAIEYFTQIATKYKNVPNLIYEIANEPQHEWEKIKQYANTIIPLIRNITPNSLILCPTKGHNSIQEVIHSELEYKNVMYVAHVYQGNGYDSQMVSTAILNDIPVFISEWSNNLDYATPNNKNTDKFIALMDRYNLSSTFFILDESNREGSLALVEQNMWDETLSDDILTETGKYAKRFFTKQYNEYEYTVADYTMPSDGNTDYGQYFWWYEYRDNITQIITTNTLTMPDNVIRAWDISNGSGNLIAYIVDDNTGNNTYIAYIACNGEKIYAYDYWRLFKNFKKTEKIDLTYLDTSNVSTMEEWFCNCYKLNEIIGLENFDTTNVTTFGQMFAYCYELENLNLSNFKTDKLTDVSIMFYSCSSLKELKLNLFKIDNIVNYDNMFFSITSGISIYVADEETAQFIYTRITEAVKTGTIYYGTEDNWTEYIA